MRDRWATFERGKSRQSKLLSTHLLLIGSRSKVNILHLPLKNRALYLGCNRYVLASPSLDPIIRKFWRNRGGGSALMNRRSLTHSADMISAWLSSFRPFSYSMYVTNAIPSCLNLFYAIDLRSFVVLLPFSRSPCPYFRTLLSPLGVFPSSFNRRNFRSHISWTTG